MKIPVILLSAKYRRLSFKTDHDAGVSLYLTKLADNLDLKAALEEVFGQ